MASESPSRSPIFRSTDLVDANDVSIPPPPPICPADIATPPAVTPANPLDAASSSVLPTHPSSKKERTKSVGKRYFSKDECAICMENFVRGEVVRILPCGHVFHKEECDEWLLKWRKLVSLQHLTRHLVHLACEPSRSWSRRDASTQRSAQKQPKLTSSARPAEQT